MSVTTSKKTYITFLTGLVIILIIAGSVWWYFSNQEAPLQVFGKISTFELDDVMNEETYHSDNEKIKLISFILINCPDSVCPLTMLDFSDLQEQLKKDELFGRDVELITITFDPERDTPEALREYADYFNVDPTGWKILRGEEENIAAVAEELKFFYSITPDGTGIHATTMFLLDREQQIRAYHRMSSGSQAMDKETIMKDIRQLVKEK